MAEGNVKKRIKRLELLQTVVNKGALIAAAVVGLGVVIGIGTFASGVLGLTATTHAVATAFIGAAAGVFATGSVGIGCEKLGFAINRRLVALEEEECRNRQTKPVCHVSHHDLSSASVGEAFSKSAPDQKVGGIQRIQTEPHAGKTAQRSDGPH